MIDVSKVKSTHTRRDAIVYIRQSHPSQVENNRESTARQYALVEKAIALGWAKGQVTTIDEDLGVSGKVFVKRCGFDHVNAEVAFGRVGILLGLEVSRLARSNADWYRLLDMCAITDTLLADNDGLYHPGLFNDRLILGTGTYQPHNRQVGSAFAWMYSLRLRSCRLIGAFVISPLPPFWIKT